MPSIFSGSVTFYMFSVPARCEVAPSSIIVVAGETVNVSLTLGGTPKPKYVRVDPWSLGIDGQAIRATSTCNTTGLHTVLNVVQNVYLRGVSRQTKINCSLAVEIARKKISYSIRLINYLTLTIKFSTSLFVDARNQQRSTLLHSGDGNKGN